MQYGIFIFTPVKGMLWKQKAVINNQMIVWELADLATTTVCKVNSSQKEINRDG